MNGLFRDFISEKTDLKKNASNIEVVGHTTKLKITCTVCGASTSANLRQVKGYNAYSG